MAEAFEMNAVPEGIELQILHPLDQFWRDYQQGLKRRVENTVFVRLPTRLRVMSELAIPVIVDGDREMVDLHAVIRSSMEARWLPESPVAAEFRHLIYRHLW